jgi:hypothetical protein
LFNSWSKAFTGVCEGAENEYGVLLAIFRDPQWHKNQTENTGIRPWNGVDTSGYKRLSAMED